MTMRIAYGHQNAWQYIGGINMKTGTEAERPGMYSSECCDHEASFAEGQTFTRCPQCSALTAWEPVEIDWPIAA